MGYVTLYTMIADEKLLGGFGDWPSDGELKSCLGGWFSACWYSHEKDVIAAMLKTGVTSVDLHGVGEESPDVWDKEFRLVDGKVEIKMFRYDLVRRIDPEPR